MLGGACGAYINRIAMRKEMQRTSHMNEDLNEVFTKAFTGEYPSSCPPVGAKISVRNGKTSAGLTNMPAPLLK